MPLEKKPLVDKAVRDAEGRVRLAVSAPYLQGGARNLRVFVLVGKSMRRKAIKTLRMNDWDSKQHLGQTLRALCDIVAMEHGVDYVVENPDHFLLTNQGAINDMGKDDA